MQYTTTDLGSNRKLFENATIVPLGDAWELKGIPQMGRSAYEPFKNVLAALGGTWNGKTHLFYRDPTASIEEMLTVGKVPQINPFSLFETPDDTVSELLDLIDMRHCDDPFTANWRILEPNAGRGAIARQIRERLPLAQIDCIEIDPINREILEAQGFNVIGHDFLEMELEGNYHYVVMNPPFNRDEYVKHITKAYGLLGHNGRFGAIAPEGMLYKGNKASKAFRNLVAERGSLDKIGNPFLTTDVKCVQIKMEAMNQEQLARLWSPKHGYPSWFHYELMLYLDNEPIWHERHNPRNVGAVVDSLVSQFLREGTLVYYDEALRDFAISEYLKEKEAVA
jgi:hypothetical protein